MTKRSQIPSQQNISFRFRFIKVPVVWDVLTGLRWEKYKAARLRKIAAKSGRALSRDEVADFERSIPPAPILRGRIEKAQSIETELFSEIEDMRRIREDFFGLPKGDIDRLADFLNRVGAWPNHGGEYHSGNAQFFPIILEPEDVWSFRDDLRRALLDPEDFKAQITPKLPTPKNALDLISSHPANNFQLRFELTDFVGGVVTLSNPRHALFATVLADIARGVPFKMCARKGCGVPFPITSRHKKKFHNEACGHLALVQKGRKKKSTTRKSYRKKAA